MNNTAHLNILEERLGYVFKDKNLLVEALTHKSYKHAISNERLEFLGDAVLDLLVGQFLFLKFPKAQEGELSKMRAAMVNENGFSQLARNLDLGKFIYLSIAEENNQGREKKSLLSDAFEAIFGAIYLEAGISTAQEIIFRILHETYKNMNLKSLLRDHKTMLQELTQAMFGEIPEYVILNTSGPDHKKEFEVAVFILGTQAAKAYGGSKKEAQQEAARIALADLSRRKAQQ
ncbi:ribonuclease III [Helicobacter monodelphidis]|nr:ribonuclease III [Helicobacter sp. 15-1451]